MNLRSFIKKFKPRSAPPPCDCIGCVAFDHAHDDLPAQWYENRQPVLLVTMVVAVGLFLVQWYYFGVRWNLKLSQLGIVCYAVGWLFDTFATQHAHQLRTAFGRYGLHLPYIEANAFLPVSPTWRDHIFTEVNLVILFFMGVTYFLPSLGIAAGLMHFLAGLGNLAGRQRAVRALQMIDQIGKLRKIHITKDNRVIKRSYTSR
jgi:hypothetical protein